MTKAKGRRGANPRAVLGIAVLVFVAIGVFVYFAKRQQVADGVEHPRLTHYVMAESALVDRADEVALEDELGRLDRDGAAQAIVVVEMRLSGGSIAEEALQIARRYRVGHAGRDDGVVLLIAAVDKKARIEVGYGLEGELTDAQSRLIIAAEIEPYLQKGDFSGAARHGAEAIVALLHPAPLAEPVAPRLGVGWLAGGGLFMLVAALIGVGVLQAIILALPGAAERIARSRRWNWFARVRILGGRANSDRDSASRDSSSSGISSGGSFGGGGAND